MIHLISARTQHLYPRECDALHRARFHHFVEGRRWRLASRDGLEIDVYDDDKAFHLIGFSSAGNIDVSCRIRPTLDGGLLPDIFPHLIDASEPSLRAPGVYECTRYFSAERLRGRAGFEARSRLHVAMVELVRDLGGQRLLGFVDLPLLAHLRRFSGLRIRPVGLPTPYEEGGAAIAFEIGVSADDLERTRRTLDIPGRQLFEAPAWAPAGLSPHRLAPTLHVLINGDAAQVDALAGFARDLCAHVPGQRSPERVYERLAQRA